jgi:uncharacterized protein (DUF488 family)
MMPEPLPTIFTIGHSTQEMAALVERLRRHDIAAIADVRSQPYSQFTPQFNREPLEQALSNACILYGFMGRELGARRPEAECYIDGKVQFDRVVGLPLFVKGLERVRRAAGQRRIALLCAEKDPVTCHRMVLICRNLRAPGLSIQHILDDGRAEPNEEAEARLLALAGLPEGDLFSTRAELIERAYDIQGRNIAYVEASAPERQQDTA